jgi:hypothetical protein
MGLRGPKPRPLIHIELYRCAESLYWAFRGLKRGKPESEEEWRENADKAGGDFETSWPEALSLLMTASRPAQVRQFANILFPEDRATNLWTEPGFPTPLECLTDHAEQFIAATNYRLFPRSARPSSMIRQLWFVSRALAAAHLRIGLTNALSMVTAERPEERATRRPRASGQKRKPASTPR